MFPVASPLPSISSATGCPALFGNFFGTTELSDFLYPCIVGVCPWDFPDAACDFSAPGGHRISRFSSKVFPYMPGVSDLAGTVRISP